MITSLDLFIKYGDPFKHPNMVLWDVPANLEIGVIPKRIYCNKDMIEPLSKGFDNLITTGHVSELITWDGCFNIRPMRGYEKKFQAVWKREGLKSAIRYMSLHSYGYAFDVNAFENRLGMKPKLSEAFVQCFKSAGFDWGGDFKGNRIDGMHFQLSNIKIN
jgi:hypothetical protein